MKRIQLGNTELDVPQIALGCMSMNRLDKQEANAVIQNALELGIDFFDHADIYGKGDSERTFAEAIGMTPAIREKITLQSKTGIRDGYYDFSKEHILKSADESLQRLGTDYLDVYILHRPDALVEPEEVAEAFTKLKESGKVRHFGVSNHNPMQIDLLKKYLDQELVVNQLQFNVTNSGLVDQGLYMNTPFEQAISRDGNMLDYARLHDMTIQAWSPFRFGYFEGIFIDHEEYPELNAKLQELAEKYNVSKSAISVAWISRHPANIQTIIGTMTQERLTNIAKSTDVELTRKEWYDLYQAVGNKLL